MLVIEQLKLPIILHLVSVLLLQKLDGSSICHRTFDSPHWLSQETGNAATSDEMNCFSPEDEIFPAR